MTTYRIAGTTDDVTDCQREGCPKTGLKKTIILRVLDEDGNEVEQVYYGSECAALVTGLRTRRNVIGAAEAADRQRESERKQAARMLEYFRPEDKIIRNTAKYVAANERWAQGVLDDGGTVQDLQDHVARRIAEWQAVLAG